MTGRDEAERRKDLEATLSTLASEQQERLARRRAEQLELPYIGLLTYPLDPDVLELLPREQAEQAEAVLFYRHGKDVRLAAVNPAQAAVGEAFDYVKKKLAVEPQLYVMSPRSLTRALTRYRKKRARVQPEGELSVTKKTVDDFETTIGDLRRLGEHVTSLSPTELLTRIVAGAVKMGASDLHIEPGQKEVRLRYRIDGVLQDITTFARSGWRLLLSRVKVLAGLKLNVQEVPQDGSFVLRVGQDTYDVRVSILPGGEGENIVLRILDRSTRVLKITELGMKERDYQVVTEELKQSNGMILVTGPTGSGKTTSLASFIQEINQPELKVITLEDPIEYRVAGVEQTQVDREEGYTFATGLRAILRQDPDIIMVGEIRDTETAETAIHAALSGHLVFSTLHTNDAPGAVPRLADMKMEPNVIAPAINLIIAQRLVRVVCEQCSEVYTPETAEREQIREAMADVAPEIFDPAVLRDSQLTFKRAQGCDACGQTGYKGRIGIFEVMPVSGEVEELILAAADGLQLQAAALRAGMTTITQDGYLKVLEGITTVDEVERVTEE